MLHYLCGSPSIHLSFNLRSYSPGGNTAFAATLKINFQRSTHRLRHGLRGYLTFRYPCFRSSVSVTIQKAASQLVFFLISTNFTSTLEILLSSIKLQLKSLMAVPELSSGISPPTFSTTYELLPSNSELR